MSEEVPEPEKQDQVPSEATKHRKERRQHRRFCCEAAATLRLIKPAIEFKGNVRDLSLTGCSIELDQRFPVGLNARVEILFQVNGLPLLIHGVSRCIHSPKLIGIEFRDVSPRRQASIGEIIAELNEKLQKEEAAKAKEATAPSSDAEPQEAAAN